MLKVLVVLFQERRLDIHSNGSLENGNWILGNSGHMNGPQMNKFDARKEQENYMKPYQEKNMRVTLPKANLANSKNSSQKESLPSINFQVLC